MSGPPIHWLSRLCGGRGRFAGQATRSSRASYAAVAVRRRRTCYDIRKETLGADGKSFCRMRAPCSLRVDRDRASPLRAARHARHARLTRRVRPTRRRHEQGALEGFQPESCASGAQSESMQQGKLSSRCFPLSSSCTTLAQDRRWLRPQGPRPRPPVRRRQDTRTGKSWTRKIYPRSVPQGI